MRQSKGNSKQKGKEIDSVVNGNADISSQANSAQVAKEGVDDIGTTGNRRTDFEFSARNGMYMQSSDQMRYEANNDKAATLKKKLTIEIHSASKEYESVEDNDADFNSSNRNDLSEGNSRQDLIFNKDNTPVQLNDEDMVKDQ